MELFGGCGGVCGESRQDSVISWEDVFVVGRREGWAVAREQKLC